MKTEVLIDEKKVSQDKIDFWLFEIQVRPSKYIIERKYIMKSIGSSINYQVNIITK